MVGLAEVSGPEGSLYTALDCPTFGDAALG